MAITFKTRAYANITMLGQVGERMLQMMGFGDAVPGAINAESVPQAMANLSRALDQLASTDVAQDHDQSDDEQPRISLQRRAQPLLELLQAAIDDETHVRWE